jgi:hypothetical protein
MFPSKPKLNRRPAPRHQPAQPKGSLLDRLNQATNRPPAHPIPQAPAPRRPRR